jgi:alpha-1,3/alpha-1,6-mannosyltransferase
VEALQELQRRGPQYAACRLVLAGGYDPRLAENVEHLKELEQLAERLGVRDSVAFLPSFTDPQRAWLLAACAAVLYTPQREHFGIVPLEAMAAGRPLVACDSGGPKESVLSGRTGYLCEPEAGAWADAMAALLAGGAAQRLGSAARQHVQAKFSREAFGRELNRRVVELAAEGAQLRKRR